MKIVQLKSSEYKRAKKILDEARYPAFVGVMYFQKIARNGGAFVAMIDDTDAGCALVNVGQCSLQVLAVHRNYQKRGIGKAMVDFLMPNWVRSLESAIPFFESMGYEPVGEYYPGKKFRTRVMVRRDLLSLAGRLQASFESKTDTH